MHLEISADRDPYDPLAPPLAPGDAPRDDRNISSKHLLRPDGVFLSYDKATKLDEWVQRLMNDHRSNNAGAQLTMIVPKELVKSGQKILRGSINTVASIMCKRADATRFRAFYNASDTAYRIVMVGQGGDADSSSSAAASNETYVQAGDTVTTESQRTRYTEAIACHPRCDIVLRFYQKDICDTFAVSVTLTDSSQWDRYTGIDTMSVTFQWLPLVPGALMPDFLRPCSVSSLLCSNVNSAPERREGCVWPGVKMGVPHVHYHDEGWRRRRRNLPTKKEAEEAANPGMAVFSKCMVPLSNVPLGCTLLLGGALPPLGDLTWEDWVEYLEINGKHR